MASVELTLASSDLSRSVTGFGPEGPESCPETGCSAVQGRLALARGKK